MGSARDYREGAGWLFLLRGADKSPGFQVRRGGVGVSLIAEIVRKV